MPGRLEGKVALVTGGNSGIGRATAIQFAQEDARVVIAARRASEGEEAVEMIRKVGGEAIFVKTDVSQGYEVEAMVDKTVETYGRLDFAHNHAAIEGPMAITHEYPEEDWDRVISINLKGVWLRMKYEIPQMLKQGGGAIVNSTSSLGLVSVPGASAYVASKSGVIGLTKTAALENAEAGIRVNTVRLGYIRTPMVERVFSASPDAERLTIEKHPIGRLGNPEEVAQTVVWLCSDAASFVTGHAMAVDGGYVAQ